MRQEISPNRTGRWLPGLIFIYVIILYANTFHVPFVWDDIYGIVEKKSLHWTRISPDAVSAIFAEKAGINRLLSNLSFAVNYYIGRHRVTGYHLVNLLIHLITAYVLYKTVRRLLIFGKIPLTAGQQAAVAGLTTILWAAHPIQTQAVTYIVQRMAALAAMFYICGLWAYLKYRHIQNGQVVTGQGRWLLLSLVAFVGGLLSKPNAALFPAAIVLVEYCFFYKPEKSRRHFLPPLIKGAFLLLLPLLLAGFLVELWGENGLFSTGYDNRPFTLQQRLLTEPRVFFFYVSLLLYPVVARFSIDHYFQVSTSLFFPETTVWAILGVLAVFVFFLFVGRRHPLLAFPALFFLVHHLAESSIFPLSLAYEHRNYLPSLFFFLPFSLALIKLLSFYEKKSKLVFGVLFFFGAAVVFLLGMATHGRNREWQSPESLWKKEIRVSPEVIRPYAALGWYYTRPSVYNLQKALWYYYQGAERAEYSFIFDKADVWRSIARIHIRRGEISKAKTAALGSLNIYRGWLEKKPEMGNRQGVKKRVAEVYALLARICAPEDIHSALSYIDQALLFDDFSGYYRARALYLMQAGEYSQSLKTLQQLLETVPQDRADDLHIAQALTLTGNYRRGYWFYRRFLAKSRQPEPEAFLYLAENRYLAGEDALGDRYVRAYIRLSDCQKIASLRKGLVQGHPDIVPFVDERKMLNKIYSHLCDWGRTELENRF